MPDYQKELIEYRLQTAEGKLHSAKILLEAGEYKTWLYDKDNNLIKNPELEKEYIDYIKEHIKYILSY